MRMSMGILLVIAVLGCARDEATPTARAGADGDGPATAAGRDAEPGAAIVALPLGPPPYVRPHIEARAEGGFATMANFRERLAAWRIAEHELEGPDAPPFPPPLGSGAAQPPVGDASGSPPSRGNRDGPRGTRPSGTDLGKLLKDLGAELEEEE